MLKSEKLTEQIIMLRELNSEDVLRYMKEGSFKISSYGENSVVHFTGDECRNLEIILSGEVTVERLDENGKILTIAEFTKNDILGGNLLFSQFPKYPMTITAKKLTRILKIDKEFLFELFCDNPSFLRRYLEYVTDHSVILSNKIKNYIGKTIRESIISFLEYERVKQNSDRIILNMTKKELSEKIGVQRTSLSRELAKMKKDGLIEFDGVSITVL